MGKKREKNTTLDTPPLGRWRRLAYDLILRGDVRCTKAVHKGGIVDFVLSTRRDLSKLGHDFFHCRKKTTWYNEVDEKNRGVPQRIAREGEKARRRQRPLE